MRQSGVDAVNMPDDEAQAVSYANTLDRSRFGQLLVDYRSQRSWRNYSKVCETQRSASRRILFGQEEWKKRWVRSPRARSRQVAITSLVIPPGTIKHDDQMCYQMDPLSVGEDTLLLSIIKDTSGQVNGHQRHRVTAVSQLPKHYVLLDTCGR
jgi:hypothetical protein